MNLRQGSHSPGRDVKVERPDYDAGVLRRYTAQSVRHGLCTGDIARPSSVAGITEEADSLAGKQMRRKQAVAQKISGTCL
jgi:hypothetical protein